MLKPKEQTLRKVFSVSFILTFCLDSKALKGMFTASKEKVRK
ncbi:hypothetical protein JCM19233_3658 [Vibrio astriarenae]|nr:hypothetical protein JCM19233_3658 [Vibrio sp. C7]